MPAARGHADAPRRRSPAPEGVSRSTALDLTVEATGVARPGETTAPRPAVRNGVTRPHLATPVRGCHFRSFNARVTVVRLPLASVATARSVSFVLRVTSDRSRLPIVNLTLRVPAARPSAREEITRSPTFASRAPLAVAVARTSNVNEAGSLEVAVTDKPFFRRDLSVSEALLTVTDAVGGVLSGALTTTGGSEQPSAVAAAIVGHESTASPMLSPSLSGRRASVRSPASSTLLRPSPSMSESQASPLPSRSRSAWSLFGSVGQLSAAVSMPSPSPSKFQLTIVDSSSFEMPAVRSAGSASSALAAARWALSLRVRAATCMNRFVSPGASVTVYWADTNGETSEVAKPAVPGSKRPAASARMRGSVRPSHIIVTSGSESTTSGFSKVFAQRSAAVTPKSPLEVSATTVLASLPRLPPQRRTSPSAESVVFVTDSIQRANGSPVAGTYTLRPIVTPGSSVLLSG